MVGKVSGSQKEPETIPATKPGRQEKNAPQNKPDERCCGANFGTKAVLFLALGMPFPAEGSVLLKRGVYRCRLLRSAKSSLLGHVDATADQDQFSGSIIY